MVHIQINIMPFSGSETDIFNEFEQLIMWEMELQELQPPNNQISFSYPEKDMP